MIVAPSRALCADMTPPGVRLVEVPGSTLLARRPAQQKRLRTLPGLVAQDHDRGQDENASQGAGRGEAVEGKWRRHAKRTVGQDLPASQGSPPSSAGTAIRIAVSGELVC